MKNIIKSNMKLVFALALWAVAYMPAVLWMWNGWWSRDSYYSHGVLIPFVSAFLIWQIRDELKTMKPKESPWGMRLILSGVFIYLFASMFRINSLSAVSMLVVFIGLVFYFYGEEIFKKIAFPVLFLVFMIPLPAVVIARLSFNLKLFAADLAEGVLNGIGILAMREGSIIKMRHAQVVVDDVCSGLRSLISLMALGSIFAYWFKGAMWKRVLIFVFTVPIAIITNMCRVVILAFIAEGWGVEYADGFIHDATGMMVFVLAFILLYVVVKLLED